MNSNNSKILNLKLNKFTVGRLSTVLRCSLHPASDDWSVSLDPPGKGVRCEPPQQTQTTWSWTRCTVHCSFSRPRSVSAGTAERPRPFKALRISSGLVDAFHVCHWVLRLEKANYWSIWWNGFLHGACECWVSPSDVMSNYDNMTRKLPSNCTHLRVSTPVRILWTNAIMSKMKPAGMAIKGPCTHWWSQWKSLVLSESIQIQQNAWKIWICLTSQQSRTHMHLGPIWGRCSCSFWTAAEVQTQKSRGCNWEKKNNGRWANQGISPKKIVKRCAVKWFQIASLKYIAV